MTPLEPLEAPPPAASRRRLVGDTAALVAAQLVGLAATLALTLLQLERMGYERYGLVSLAVAAVGVFTFLDYGLSWAALRYVPSLRVGDRPGLADSAASLFVLVSLVLGVLVAAAAGTAVLLAHAFGEDLLGPDRRSLFVLCLLLLPALMTSNVLSNVARSLGRFRAAAYVYGGFFLTTNVVWAAAAGRRYDVEVVIAWQVAFSVGAAFFWHRLIRRSGLPGLRLFARLSEDVVAHRAMLLRFAGYSAIAGLSTSLFLAADKIAFAGGIGVEELPFYAIAVALCSRIAIVAASLTGVAFPQLAAAHAADDTVEYVSLSRWSLRATTVSTVAVASGLFWAGPHFFSLWISDEFADSTTATVRALAVGFAIQAVGQLGYAANDARGRVRRTMASGLLVGGGGVLAAGIAAGALGLVGGAIVFACALSLHGVIGLLLGFGRPSMRSVSEGAALVVPSFVGVGAAELVATGLGAGAAGALGAAAAASVALLLVQAKLVQRRRKAAASRGS